MTQLRRIAAPFVVPAPVGVSTRDRLRPMPAEAAALAAIGEFLDGLYRADYAVRATEGRLDARGRAESRRDRKRALTGLTSSRWAGAITRRAEDQYTLGLRSLFDHRASLRAALRVLDDRLALAPGEAVTNAHGRRTRGYRDCAEWFNKTRRRAVLADRLMKVERRIETARPTVVHGGGQVWRNRQHLAAAGLTAASWRERWDTSRWFLTADGETGKKFGNETIRVDPDGHVTIKVPTALVEKYGSHLQLSVPLNLGTHRAAEWRDRISTNRAVGYRIVFDPATGRWYLHASWTCPKTAPTPLSALQAARTLAVDLNGDHLAGWVVDPSGNPVARPITVSLTMAGSTTLRDASLRHGIARLLRTALRRGCGSITIENLNFADSRRVGRETTGRGKRGKRFRRIVAGIPTGQFRDRLVAMASEVGIAVVAVDPAYTSRWGAEHWLEHLTQRRQTTSDPAVTRHHAAAVVIGRRAHRLPARRRAVRSQHVTEDMCRPNPASPMTSIPPNRGHVTSGTPLLHPKASSPTGRADASTGSAVQHRSGPPARESPPLSSVLRNGSIPSSPTAVTSGSFGQYGDRCAAQARPRKP